jgi:hypothetical protein
MELSLTNQKTSNPLARIKRLVIRSTLDHCDLFLERNYEQPAGVKKHHWSSAQRSVLPIIFKNWGVPEWDR